MNTNALFGVEAALVEEWVWVVGMTGLQSSRLSLGGGGDFLGLGGLELLLELSGVDGSGTVGELFVAGVGSPVITRDSEWVSCRQSQEQEEKGPTICTDTKQTTASPLTQRSRSSCLLWAGLLRNVGQVSHVSFHK